jgi:hypothetical protein
MKHIFIKPILLLAFLFHLCNYVEGQNRNNSEINIFATYISTHGKEPVDYIMDKFKNHYVVALGEDHWIKDHPLFLCDLIKRINERKDSLNIDVLAIEFGNVVNQKLADEFINSTTYREDLVIKILQSSPDLYGWPYLEVMQIFKTVWEENQKKSEEQKTRILILDPPYMIQVMNGETYNYTCSRDESMLNIIRSQLLKKKRILFYAGLLHTRKTVYGSYLSSDNIYYNQTSAGFLLKSLYPHLVFSIKLWGGLMGSNGYNKTYEPIKWERLYNGTIDEAFKINHNKPVGFDIDKSPFSQIPVTEFYKTSNETLNRSDNRLVGSPYNKSILLKDDADGIIFFKPVEEFTGATIYQNFFDDDFIKLINKRTDGKVTNRADAVEKLKALRPILETD